MRDPSAQILKIKAWLIDCAKTVVPTFIIALILFKCIIGVAIVNGISMEPTLNDGEIVILRRIGYQPTRGDIVVCNTTQQNMLLVKRVIAISGDTVDIDFNTGIVYVNGEALDEPYTKEPTYKHYDVTFPQIVDDGHVFVMGDNRNNSLDSRTGVVGQIPVEQVIGGYLVKIPKIYP